MSPHIIDVWKLQKLVVNFLLPPPKKKIECPKQECVEKKVVECIQKHPCDTTTTKTVVVPSDQAAVPKVVPVAPVSDEGFAASALKPLSSLAPPAPTVTVQ